MSVAFCTKFQSPHSTPLSALSYSRLCRSLSRDLLDCPEDAAFYDWLLLDPKDSPYATFRLYYRSWARLRYINVIPPPRLSDTAGLYPCGVLGEGSPFPTVGKRSSRPKLSFGRPIPECDVESPGCDGIQDRNTRDESPSRGIRAPFPLANPPETLQARPSSSCPPQPSKESRDGFLDQGSRRPLPALPSRPSRGKKLSSGASTSTITPTNPLVKQEGRGLQDSDGGREIHSLMFSPNHTLTPPPLTLSSKKSSKTQGSPSRTPSLDKDCPGGLSPLSKLRTSQGAAIEKEQAEGSPGHQSLRPSPSSQRSGEPGTDPPTGSSHSKSTPSEAEEMSPNQNPDVELREPPVQFGPKNGIHAMPRGLLGPALTEIPLRGQTGDLMKRLRSEDPFRDE